MSANNDVNLSNNRSETENGSAKPDRREFLRTAGTAALGAAVVAATATATGCNTAQIEAAVGQTRRYGMLIDLRRCVKCESCTIACMAENNIPVDSSRENSRRIMWNHLVYEEKGGDRPTLAAIPQPCNHCDDPPCVKVCPVGATYKDESRGLVLQNYDKCIGCRYCATACPYTRRYFNWEEPSFPHVERTGDASFIKTEGGFNPLVPLRKKGVTEKCVFCVHRIVAAEERAKSEGRELRDGEVQPACVTTCIGAARVFGDLDDPKSGISRISEKNKGRVVQLEENLGTGPKVFYIQEEV